MLKSGLIFELSKMSIFLFDISLNYRNEVSQISDSYDIFLLYNHYLYAIIQFRNLN